MTRYFFVFIISRRAPHYPQLPNHAQANSVKITALLRPIRSVCIAVLQAGHECQTGGARADEEERSDGCAHCRPTPAIADRSVLARKKVTIQQLRRMRKAGEPITVLTAYDFRTGRACDKHGVDITLVGDSLAQVCLGYDSTTRLTMDEMVHHCRAVARGSHTPLCVADMPFGSYHTGEDDTVRNAVRLVREGGVEAVKIEGGLEILSHVRRLTSLGIPVMAHVGLMPQRHASCSGYRVQGREATSAAKIHDDAVALQEAGAFSIVLEAIPHKLATYITKQLDIPTIGIGSGPETSGQVLVWDDVMTTWEGHKAKFVRRFADVGAEQKKGVEGFIEAVRQRQFPNESESYDIEPHEWQTFLDRRSAGSARS